MSDKLGILNSIGNSDLSVSVKDCNELCIGTVSVFCFCFCFFLPVSACFCFCFYKKNRTENRNRLPVFVLPVSVSVLFFFHLFFFVSVFFFICFLFFFSVFFSNAALSSGHDTETHDTYPYLPYRNAHLAGMIPWYRWFLNLNKKGIVVGKVKVMANCRKKLRQIVQLSGQPSQG